MSDAAEAYRRLRELKFIPEYACDLIEQLCVTEADLAILATDDPEPGDQNIAPSQDIDVSVQRGNYCILDLDTSHFHCFAIDDFALADASVAPSLRNTACWSYPAPSSAFANMRNDDSLEVPAVASTYVLYSLLPFVACMKATTQSRSKALAVPVHPASTGSRKRRLDSEAAVEHRIAMVGCSHHAKKDEPHEGAAVRDNAGVSAAHIDDLMTNEELSEFMVIERGRGSAPVNSNDVPGRSMQSSAAVASKLELPTDLENCYILRGRNVCRYVPGIPKERRPKDRRAKGFWGVCSTMGFNARNRNCAGKVTVVLKDTLQGQQQHYECNKCGHSRIRYRL
ncbi:hypothetical protein AAVH_05792 [Aphelenchoides avenae]|nr:hypothetical protein AAVH_05792 [Aphelenchus avenae]